MIPTPPPPVVLLLLVLFGIFLVRLAIIFLIHIVESIEWSLYHRARMRKLIKRQKEEDEGK